MSGRSYRTTREERRITRSEIPVSVTSGGGSGTFTPPPPPTGPFLQANFSDETQFEGWGFW